MPTSKGVCIAAYVRNEEPPFRNPFHVGSAGCCQSSIKAYEFAKFPISLLSLPRFLATIRHSVSIDR